MAASRVDAGRDRALRLRRSLFGPLTRVLNPLIQRIAGGAHMPVVGVVYHQGRRSGRTFATPVGLGSNGAAFLIPLTFGADSDWCRNVLAAGRCSMKWRGTTYTALEPAVVQDVAVRLELARAFDPLQRLAFRLMGMHTFLRLRIADCVSAGCGTEASLPLALRLLRPVLPMLGKIHRHLYRKTGGMIGGRISGTPVLLLTTIGRRTGKQRTTAIGYMRSGVDFVVIAGAAGSPKHPDWWLNLNASPEANIQIGRRVLGVRATAASAEVARHILAQNPAQSALYDAMQRAVTREIPVVLLQSLAR